MTLTIISYLLLWQMAVSGAYWTQFQDQLPCADYPYRDEVVITDAEWITLED